MTSLPSGSCSPRALGRAIWREMNKYLYDALPFLHDIDRERQEQFENYFRSAPLWLIDAFQVVKLKRGIVFSCEGDPADTIFFVGQGVVEALDYRVFGMPYEYMRFNRVHAFGGMEFIMELDSFLTTLRTVTDCTLVKIPRPQFEKWMYSDIEALRREARLVGEYLATEARHNRVMLFLDGPERLALLLAGQYEQFGRGGVLQVSEGRQRLANKSGLCVKSVNRSIKKFADSGLISKEGNRITVSREQYEGLCALLSQKIQMDHESIAMN